MIKQEYFDKLLDIRWKDVLKKLGYTAKEKPQGYLMKCIFHKERTASLFFFDTDKSGEGFHCYGCGQIGSMFNFVKKIKGMKGALNFFEKNFGIKP